MVSSVFVVGFLLVIKQINTRGFDFSYSGYTSNYTQFEQKSKALQKQILGQRLYQIMTTFDKQFKFYF